MILVTHFSSFSSLSASFSYDSLWCMTSISTRNVFQTAARLSDSWKVILTQLAEPVSARNKFAGTLFWDARRSIPASSWMLQTCWTSRLQILDSSSIIEILAVLQMSLSKYSLNTWIAQNCHRLKVLKEAKHAHIYKGVQKHVRTCMPQKNMAGIIVLDAESRQSRRADSFLINWWTLQLFHRNDRLQNFEGLLEQKKSYWVYKIVDARKC